MSDDRQDSNDAEDMVPADDAVIGVAFKWSMLAVVVIGAAVAAWMLLRGDREPAAAVVVRAPVVAPAPLNRAAPSRKAVRFTDVTAAAGISFTRFNGATGEKLLPETMGGGVAFLDFDGDRDQDLLFVNGAPWPGSRPPARPPTLALYRNDGSGRFEDVTRAAGLAVTLQGMGVAVGDYDGDGDADVFIGALGRDRLYRNDGGIFHDVTQQAGVGGTDDAWTTSAGFFDHDLDGDLDLFACHYIHWTEEIDRRTNFTLNGRDRAYGPPHQYQGTHSTLWRNEGDGRFLDVSAEAGIQVANRATGVPVGKGLALTFVDVDADGDLDVFVANDTVQNFLFRNEGDGTFEEVGAASGTAYDEAGLATGAMGVDAADYANAGGLAIAIGNFANEATSFYVQQAQPWRFADLAGAEGIGSPSRLRLKFGVLFLDHDLDGRLDLLQANGHLEDEINEVQPSQHYEQAAQLFWNAGDGGSSTFVVVPDEDVGDLARPIVGRGAAYADIDGDGDLDVVLTQPMGPPLLLRNDQALQRHWLRVWLEGSRANRDAIGAQVAISSGGVTQRRTVMPTRSYLSQVELPLTFGLGDATTVDALRVTWPGGGVSEIAVEGVDREILIVEPATD